MVVGFRARFVETCIKTLYGFDLMTLWNKYCEVHNFTNDFMYTMGEFDWYMRNKTPLEVLENVDLTDFDTDAPYFMDTLYGCVSFDDSNVDCYIRFEELVDWVVNDYIDEFFDKYNFDEQDYIDEFSECFFETKKYGDFDEFLKWFKNNYEDDYLYDFDEDDIMDDYMASKEDE